MQASVFRAVEFDRIREALAREASTSLGRERAYALEPEIDRAEVQHRLNRTSEALALESSTPGLAIDGPEDLADILAHLEVAGEPLAPLQLLGLARFASSVSAVVDRVRAGKATGIAELVANARSFIAESDAVRRAIEPSGDVADHASQALADIREGLRKHRAKLRSTIEGLTRGRDKAKYLQDQIITDRNGRYVVVVRSEHREAIPGIVHGASTSGASLYLEPLSTVGLNNDIVALVEREKTEVFRILLALTDAFRAREADLSALLAAAADLDELHAKARLAQRMDGVAPEITNEGHLEFRGARHPLLIPAVRDLLATDEPREDEQPSGPAVVIPSDLLLSPPAKALIISGPNTGGKTVALKAFGLLALMAQAGLLIPVDTGSKLTPFRTVFADIGDEQSIAASLSTFSAHIANLVSMGRQLELPSLILLDEIGSGTDPVEGGALGAAVIDHFRKRGAIVIATTHDDALKSYGATTDGVIVAAFGFNADTFAPTYTLRYGAPGRSLALEIARRLGMPPAVVADAEARRSGRESLLAAHLARVDRELASVEELKTELRAERESMAADRRTLLERESRLAEREAVLRKRQDDKIADRLREARAQVDDVVTRLRTKADALVKEVEQRAHDRGPSLSTGEVGSLRAEARAALESIASVIEPGDDAATSDRFDSPPAIGQTVLLAAFGAEGIVRGLSGNDVDVEVRGKRMRVPLSGLRRSGGGQSGSATKPSAIRSGGSRGQSKSGGAAGPARELVLIGATVDDALDRLEKFLDDAVLNDERRLRIVHGYGTGRLREAVRTALKRHPLVATAMAAADNEGGDAATIVELKD